MSLTSGHLFSIFALTAFSATAVAQNKPQLTARELFYAAVQTPKATTATTTPATPKQPATTPKKALTQVASAQPRPTTPTPTGNSRPEAPTLPDGGRIIQAAARPSSAPAPTEGPALGLRYTILKKTDAGTSEVAPDSIFRSGDHIQLKVEANMPGYLYIISQGSSGKWEVRFPAADVEDGNNKVDGWHAITFPSRKVMTFDEQKGTERIFVIFSREPVPDIQDQIYSLGSKTRPASKSDAPPKPQQPVLIQANLNIPDATIGRLRNVYSRDLIIEKVDESTPGDKKEKAVYVVDPTGRSNSRLSADIELVHQ